MDSSAVPFEKTEEQGCNYCESAKLRLQAVRSVSSSNLNRVIEEIRQKGKGAQYDCVVGVSGGVDSSWLLQWAVNQDLRVLAVHMDNCWNSSQASINISNLISGLGCDLYTVVLPWHQERAAKLALFKSDVVDVELLYDNALHKVCFETAKVFGIKTVLGGQNNASEGVEIPRNWAWKKFDGTNLKNILKAGDADYKGLPILTSTAWLKYLYVCRINWLNILDLLPEFSKDSALELLVTEYNYSPYGFKHYENVFTRFYQGEILPKKFGIDKRRAHLSSQIVAGELTRDEAIKILQTSTYPNQSLLELDRETVISKLGLTRDELDEYIDRPARSHKEFGTDLFLDEVVPKLLKVRQFLLRSRN